MGNNGSSSRDQQQAASVCSNGPTTMAEGTNRGWSQSFPRELTRHRSQPTAARKVLPEPPNQRLRATDNGSIIHNGGTISGRRAPTFASSRDLAKRNEPPSFRDRSCSASNLVQPRSRKIDRQQHCCRYQSTPQSDGIPNCGNDLKKFGSEPDLRYSPDLVCPPDHRAPTGNSSNRQETRTPAPSCLRYGKQSKESRLENGYKARKKYKAPAPPPTSVAPNLVDETALPGGVGDESRSAREFDTRLYPHSQFDHQHHHRYRVLPPPRRSRLFKTRAESKKAQISWQLSSPLPDHDRQQPRLEQREPTTSRWTDVVPSNRKTEQRADDAIVGQASADRRDRGRCSNVDELRRRSKLPDHGKNTLQRSMSSPEFQAELIRVAKSVRDKLDANGRTVDEATHDRRCDRSVDRASNSHPVDSGASREDAVDREGIGKSDRSRGNHENRSTKNAIRSARPLDGVESNERRRLGNPENSNPGGWNDRRRSKVEQPLDRKWTDTAVTEKSDAESRGKEYVEETRNSVSNERSDGEHDQPRFASTAQQQSAPKTFYFGMNECSSLIKSRNEEDQDTGKELDVESKFRDRGDGRLSVVDATDDTDDNERSVVENISLKLRPTLPKKQLEIPRFSPSAAWRLLSALETPGPSMSTASEEMPVMFEERIERLSRPPPPFPLSLGPRSWHDKSGDSGISGDAGAANEDSLDVSTINRMKTTVTRPTWTPQQDLGEESSSDAGVDSPPPLPTTPLKYHSPRGHVFSLSLPRDEARTLCLCAPEPKAREASAFNSLQKLKRSVSGAFGIGTHDHQKKCTRDVLDDNWLLSTSAPTSLQHNNRVRIESARISPSVWRPFPSRDDRVGRRVRRQRGSDDGDERVELEDDDGDDDDDDDDDVDNDPDVDNAVDIDVPEHEDEERVPRANDAIERGEKVKANDFPVIMKPPSFSYLTPGGHVMYLPEANDDTEDRAQNFDRSVDYPRTPIRARNGVKRIGSFRLNAYKNTDGDDGDDDDDDIDDDIDDDDDDDDGDEDDDENVNGDEDENVMAIRRKAEKGAEEENEDEEDKGKVDNAVSRRRCKSLKNRIGANDSKESKEFASCPESRENASQPKQRRTFSPASNEDRTTATPWTRSEQPSCPDAKGTKPQRKSNSRSRRFTFQSTVRQIERRRLAEKLSREVEAKERQRRGELEAMRKVEEEFQRKRAKEKANIRQQLRLFKEMEESFNSLPTPDWDGSQLSRADPDGAPSSTASSPTSLPAANSSAVASGKRATTGDADSAKQSRVERKGYRPKYYDWPPDTSNHLDHRQTTVHPKIVCDIPKSSPVFVDANIGHPTGKPVTSNSTPKSDNYRKDFAHGTVVVTRTSFASSDSELSQPNTRPHSRQNGIKSKPQRLRSSSPARSEEAATSEEDSPLPMEATKHPRNPIHDFILSGVQPFTKRKTYRPIIFNPRPPPPVPT